MVLSLLHNDVLKKLNWTGQGDKDKQSFRDLNCRLVIEGRFFFNFELKI